MALRPNFVGGHCGHSISAALHQRNRSRDNERAGLVSFPSPSRGKVRRYTTPGLRHSGAREVPPTEKLGDVRRESRGQHKTIGDQKLHGHLFVLCFQTARPLAPTFSREPGSPKRCVEHGAGRAGPARPSFSALQERAMREQLRYLWITMVHLAGGRSAWRTPHCGDRCSTHLGLCLGQWRRGFGVDSAPVDFDQAGAGRTHATIDFASRSEWFGVLHQQDFKFFGAPAAMRDRVSRPVSWMNGSLAPVRTRRDGLSALCDGATYLGYIGDKGYGPGGHRRPGSGIGGRHLLLPLRRNNQHAQWPDGIQRLLASWRHRIETRLA